MVCFELEASWPRSYDWTDDKPNSHPPFKYVNVPFEDTQSTEISVLISKSVKGLSRGER